jgi:erythromycin esterase
MTADAGPAFLRGFLYRLILTLGLVSMGASVDAHRPMPRILALTSDDPVVSGQDLDPLLRRMRLASVVGLGEATHGTREFTLLKHRILHHLLASGATTILALEASFADSLALDAFIQGGPGSASGALLAMAYWMHQTKEMVSMLEWMRIWNLDPRHANKIHIVGVDPVNPHSELDCALEALAASGKPGLKAVTPLEGSQLKEAFSKVSLMKKLDGKGLAKLRSTIQVLARQADGIQDGEAAARIHQHLRMVAQGMAYLLAFGRMPLQLEARERNMADNVRWCQGRLPAAGKVVFWAHNGHIRTGRHLGTLWAGGFLRRALGPRYLAAGMLLGQGGLRSMAKEGDKWNRKEIDLVPPGAGTLEAVFDRTGFPFAYLDLRCARGVLDPSLACSVNHISIGASFSEPEDRQGEPIVAKEDFDLLMFIKVGHVTQPLLK